MASETGPTQQQPPQNREQEALAALHAHRQRSGYVPWNNDDNERLRALDKHQKQQARDRRDLRAGVALYRRRATRPAPAFRPIADEAPQIAQDVAHYDPAPDPYRTSLAIARDLIARQMERESQALDLWKAHCRRHRGQGENLTYGDAVAVLVAGGMSERSAKRALKRGTGLLWDRRPDRRDHRLVWYHLRGYHAIQRALGLASCGKWVRLPLDAYAGKSGTYASHVLAAWLDAHDRVSRATQARAFGRTKNTVRAMQRAAGQAQTAVVVTARAPRTDDEVIELGQALTPAEGDADQKHHWRGAGQSYAWQDTNRYGRAPARPLGRKRSAYIRAKAERATCRATMGMDVQSAPATPPPSPKRFDRDRAYDRADRWQKRHPDRAALIFNTWLPRQRALAYSGNARGGWPITRDQAGRALTFEYSYSYGARGLAR